MTRNTKTALTLFAIGSALLLGGCQTHKEPTLEKKACRANVMTLDSYIENNCFEQRRFAWEK